MKRRQYDILQKLDGSDYATNEKSTVVRAERWVEGLFFDKQEAPEDELYQVNDAQSSSSSLVHMDERALAQSNIKVEGAQGALSIKLMADEKDGDSFAL